MIIYSYVDGSYCEPRFYFNYGEMIFVMVADFVPSEDEFSPFYPPIQHYFGDIQETEATTFFRKLVPFDWTQTTKWPLPIYDWETTPENKKNSEMVREFLLHYLFPKYWDCYLLPYGKEDTEEEKERVYHRFFDKFMNLLIASFYKYAPMIKLYKDKEASLLDRVKSESKTISRFNDTPQEGGDFADENHTTNATTARNLTESDYETPMARLAEIREKFENLYNAWASDFDILFAKGGETL